MCLGCGTFGLLTGAGTNNVRVWPGSMQREVVEFLDPKINGELFKSVRENQSGAPLLTDPT